MTILILSSLLFIGLILILAEVILIPGTTIVGIFGFLVSITGIFYAFLSYDTVTAAWITAISVLANFAAIVYGFRSGVWNRFSLKSTMVGGSFDGRTLGLEVDMVGKAVSDVKPFGKAIFGERIVEVKSEQGFIPVDSEVKIIKIENNKIIVI
jgi:membrane-bound ClpP family serine protease